MDERKPSSYKEYKHEKIELDNCFSKLNDKIAMYALKIAENKAELDEAKISVKNADKNTK